MLILEILWRGTIRKFLNDPHFNQELGNKGRIEDPRGYLTKMTFWEIRAPGTSGGNSSQNSSYALRFLSSNPKAVRGLSSFPKLFTWSDLKTNKQTNKQIKKRGLWQHWETGRILNYALLIPHQESKHKNLEAAPTVGSRSLYYSMLFIFFVVISARFVLCAPLCWGLQKTDKIK